MWIITSYLRTEVEADFIDTEQYLVFYIQFKASPEQLIAYEKNDSI